MKHKWLLVQDGSLWEITTPPEDVDFGVAVALRCPFVEGREVDAFLDPDEDIIFESREAAAAYARIMGVKLQWQK